MTIQYAMISEAGDRSENEDAVRIEKTNTRYLFALADGLGSYGNGRIASDLAVTAAADCFFQDSDPGSVLGSAMQEAQKAVLKRQQKDVSLSSMCTTLALLYLAEGSAVWAHIGDSRIYYFPDKQLREYTRDHSVPQLLVSLGQIRDDEVRGHPDQNRLLKAIGREWSGIPYSMSELYSLNGTEWFLICSDGFWEYIDEKQMEQCLKTADTPEQWLLMMKEITIQQSAGIVRDNYSAICVCVTGEREGKQV